MTDITVSTVDFRNAVLATRPHLPDPKADHLTDLCRVHCRIERYGLILSATNTVTAALAMVDTVDLADGEVGTAFDLGPDEAREIVTLFRPAKKASGESMDSALRLQVDPVDDALVSLADWTCATCTTEGRRGSCCPGRCYCGHDTCHAFASWTPRPVLNVTDISKPKGKKGSAWAEREESTWIDKL